MARISDATLGLWAAPPRTTRGGLRRYSDLSIEQCLTPGAIFKQPLRQPRGLMPFMVKFHDTKIEVPVYSNLLLRSKGTIPVVSPRSPDHPRSGSHQKPKLTEHGYSHRSHRACADQSCDPGGPRWQLSLQSCFSIRP